MKGCEKLLAYLYDYNLNLGNELLGEVDVYGNLIEYVERFCNDACSTMPEEIEAVEEIVKRRDFFQYMISEIISGDNISIGSMEVFPELCGNRQMNIENYELFGLFCVVVNNYFRGLYNEDWEFVDLDKYNKYSDERIFIGESKLHVDGKIELVIYSEPIKMRLDDDSLPTGEVEYIEVVHSAKNVDIEIRNKIKSIGITKEYRYHKKMLLNEYSCIAAESYNIAGAEVHGADLFIFVDSIVGDTVYSDCMMVIEGYRYLPQNHFHNHLEVGPEWHNIENKSLFMSFREFLSDGCEMDEFNFDEKTSTIQILGNGHYEIKEASVFCNIRLGFTGIKLFWNAEYDYYTSEKLAGAERYFLS